MVQIGEDYLLLQKNDREAAFRLLDEHPTLVRGLLHELTARVVELLNRVTDLTGRRVEPRFGHTIASLDDIAIWAVFALIMLDWTRVGLQLGFLAVFAVAAWLIFLEP